MRKTTLAILLVVTFATFAQAGLSISKTKETRPSEDIYLRDMEPINEPSIPKELRNLKAFHCIHRIMERKNVILEEANKYFPSTKAEENFGRHIVVVNKD